jgi:hypothetical protein
LVPLPARYTVALCAEGNALGVRGPLCINATSAARPLVVLACKYHLAQQLLRNSKLQCEQQSLRRNFLSCAGVYVPVAREAEYPASRVTHFVTDAVCMQGNFNVPWKIWHSSQQ